MNKQPLPFLTPGFTLLELLVVMAILAMLAAVVIPRISSGSMTLLQAQARQAIAVLNYARRTAIVEGKSQVALLSAGESAQAGSQTTVSTNVIQWVSHGATLQMEDPVNEDKSSDGNLVKPVARPQEGELSESATSYQITFYPEGGSSGGDLILSYQGHQIKIIINHLTGKVTSEFIDTKK